MGFTPTGPQSPSGNVLAGISRAVESDPAFLALAAGLVSDLELIRIGGGNRYWQLEQLGLDQRHPYMRRAAVVLKLIEEAEHKSVLALQHLMRQHRFGDWVRRNEGVGEKQAGRLLAVIGDPYIRPDLILSDGSIDPSRPRTVSELWAYCGFHVLPAHHAANDAHPSTVGGNQAGHPGQTIVGTQMKCAGVAPTRKRGQRGNWSTEARSRTRLIAESCIKRYGSPFRPVYDEGREKYADAVHTSPCVRCGPKGSPALVGSPLSDGHKHARALRLVAKEILKSLWLEGKRLHEVDTRE
jgi:hypothetical protein